MNTIPRHVVTHTTFPGATKALVLIALSLLACCSSPQSNTSGLPEIPVTGPERWVVDDARYSIHGTAVVAYPTGEQLFVVKVLYDGPMSESERPVALAIARFATSHQYPERARSMTINGRPIVLKGDIGVALMKRVEMLGQSTAAGYRFHFDARELGVEPVDNAR